MSIDRIQLFGNNDEDDDDDQNNGEKPHFEPEVIGDSDRQQSEALDPKPWSLTVEGIERNSALEVTAINALPEEPEQLVTYQ